MNRLVEILEKEYYSARGLFLGILLLFLLVFLPSTILFLSRTNAFIFFILMCIVYFGIWQFIRNTLPHNEGKIGIILSFETENDKQSLRVKKDLANDIEKLLAEKGLSQMFNVIVPKTYQTNRINKVLTSYSQAKRLGSNMDNEELAWKKLNSKIHAHLYIFGDIKERINIDNCYYLNLSTIVVHALIDNEESKTLAENLRLIIPREISFFEQAEVVGFGLLSRLLYFGVRYIVGIAAYVSNDVRTAYALHEGLKMDLSILPPYAEETVRNKLDEWLISELIILAQDETYTEGITDNKRNLIQKARAINPNNYGLLIYDSVDVFNTETKPYKAIRILNKAKTYSNGDYTWLYNRAFLYMFAEKFKVALDDYIQIESVKFRNEEIIVNQCLVYNTQTVQTYPSKPQFLFVIAFLYLRKLNNLPQALTFFEEFIKKAEHNRKFSILLQKAQLYVDEIGQMMGIAEVKELK